MDLINDFRDKDRILTIQKIIQSKISKPINIMEICGGHTHSIMKFGLPSLLPKEINFVHGPGCPVCVMPRERIDTALKLASMPNTIFCVLGDMLRVPGSYESLIDLRAKGADVRALYTPLEVIDIALENKDKTIIFFAIGFETTTPMSASIIQKRIELQLENLFFHINHVLVPPAVEAIMQDEKVKIDAFLGPSHVSVITGSNIYEPIAKKYKTPIAVSGFEPVDIMLSVLNIVEQMNANTYEVYNEYHRVVSKEGNLKAKSLMQTYFQPCDFEFRGLGVIKDGGLCLKDEFSNLDASKVFDCKVQSKDESKACICGQILRGLAKPYDCKVFAKACTPKNPIGSCMVSSEGACAAYYKYHQN
ncbi:hydrogenase formation protein HypD [Campylobacter volucris]|uniref:Hydrogenase formation protein HypD n=1 Tax=Campylobacter volucris TaxID=1031542 RepID=A0AAE6CZA4_9BACT|nr:hydrogenase formation protein HypD [Campylobacter volucris]AJC94087.1 hydrogenase expression/formation protein HypD [Campylobacter volucris LMG 24379]KAB0580247.1 hydrogenase formation protein HypD [Campylobacter volucris]MBF7069176.1 hydrogenase formation protein HypD [Campylobacter volucris]QBL13538.1 hydrogenase formation protein HypD [Campylobacter volucris]QEL08302.1 hydrogenase expression/formation protein HypD [Campylobacter volucris]